MIPNLAELPRAPDPIVALRSSERARATASVLLALFLIATLLVPVAVVNKLIIVMLFGLMLIAPIASRGKVKVRTLSPIIVLSIFLYGFALAFIGQSDSALTNQLMLSVAILILIYLIDWYAIDLDYLIRFSAIVLCLFTALAIYVVVTLSDTALGGYFTGYFLAYSLPAAGSRSFSDSALVMFRFGSVPFLFVPCGLFLESFLTRRRIRDLLAFLLVISVLAVSTSRALVLGSVLASGYLVIRRMRPSLQVMTICVGAALVALFTPYVLTNTSIFSLSEFSNSVKVGHVISFAQHMTPARLTLGDGLAATYFSIGYNEVVPQTEITLLDMVRYFGLPLTALLYAALLFPVAQRDCYGGANRPAVVLFLTYLLISLTNPVLFNSFGLVVVLWYWSRILDGHRRLRSP